MVVKNINHLILFVNLFLQIHSAFAQNGTQAQRKLVVGLLMPMNMSDVGVEQNIGYYSSAGAVILALNRVTDENLLPNTNITFVIMHPQCDEALAGGYTARMIEQGVDVIIGPPSPSG
uniref:Receptor ligand binding region domain-containing protein n=1 Tax=Acrobeloides nanus TaxID=290746 RepID=A0A914CSY9_9BILA